MTRKLAALALLPTFVFAAAFSFSASAVAAELEDTGDVVVSISNSGTVTNVLTATANSGNNTARGADGGRGGRGGDGGDVELNGDASEEYDVLNSSTGNGGNGGAGGAGGTGGSVNTGDAITTLAVDNLINTNDIEVDRTGPDAATTTFSEVEITATDTVAIANSYDLTNVGTVGADSGNNTAGAGDAGDAGNADDGGDVELNGSTPDYHVEGVTTGAGGNGGAGGAGGTGGSVTTGLADSLVSVVNTLNSNIIRIRR